MTTQQNPMAGRYFNDPNFAAAISNLAGAFAPPSPEEYLLAEKVKGERFQNENLADLYANVDEFDPMALDRRAALLGAYTPNQGFNAVNMADATARRGQDIIADTSRYNTVATGLINRASTPLTDRQALAPISDELADFIGGPALPAVSGADLGATPTPLSETEMMALIMGQQDPATQRSFLDPNTVNTVGPDGRPVITPEIDAIGQQAYTDPGSQAAADMVSYIDPNGGEGTAVFDPNTRTLVDIATKEPLPTGTRTYKLQGGDKALMTGATSSNTTKGNQVIADAQYGLGRVGQFRKLLEENPGVLGLPGTIRGFAQDVVAGALEMGAAFGDAKGVIDSVDEVRQLAERVTGSGNYDPAIAQAYSYALEMAYLQAKMQDPGGEVNVRELERLLSTFDGGIAGNSQVLANLDVLQGQLNDRITYGSNLRDGAKATPVPLPGASAGGKTSSGIQWSIEP